MSGSQEREDKDICSRIGEHGTYLTHFAAMPSPQFPFRC